MVSPVRLPSGDMFDLHQAARLCLTVLSPPSARMRDAWSVSDVASALPEPAAGDGSYARWPGRCLRAHSCFLFFFLRAKSCLKLPPLSSYRMLTGFWFRLAENDSQRSKSETQSLKWSRPLLMLRSGLLMISLWTHTSEGRDEQQRRHIVYQTFS